MKKIENNFAVTGFVAKDAEVRQFTVSIRFTTYFLEVFENIWDKIWRN